MNRVKVYLLDFNNGVTQVVQDCFAESTFSSVGSNFNGSKRERGAREKSYQDQPFLAPLMNVFSRYSTLFQRNGTCLC